MKLQPIGKRIVIKKIEAEKTTDSGIVLPQSAQEAPQYAEVVEISDAIKNSEKKGNVLQVGDKVIYSQYAGTEVELEGEEYIVINFKDVLAVIR